MNNVRRTQYPKLTVDTRKLYNNIKTVADDCKLAGNKYCRSYKRL